MTTTTWWLSRLRLVDKTGMQLIVITHPQLLDNEPALIEAVLDAGADRVHLRKPDATAEEVEALIRQIHPNYYKRLVVHDWHELARRYALGGIHLNRRHPQAPTWATTERPEFTISSSCHSLDELTATRNLSYRTLSPIFDSLSKQGYASGFSEAALKEAAQQGQIDKQTVALGGIMPKHIPQLQALGFGGVAVLGYVWESGACMTETVAARILSLKEHLLCFNS